MFAADWGPIGDLAVRPFVMNREEIETALNEYRLGTFLKQIGCRCRM